MQTLQLKSASMSGTRIGSTQITRATRPALPARPSRRNVSVRAYMAPMESLRLVSQIATSVSLAVGAWWVSREMMLEQDRFENTAQQPCPRCGGTGYEPCMCTRWSDGDAGCSSCNRSGYMQCRGCNGGGTAVPIKIALRRDGSQQQQR